MGMRGVLVEDVIGFGEKMLRDEKRNAKDIFGAPEVPLLWYSGEQVGAVKERFSEVLLCQAFSGVLRRRALAAP